MAGKQLMDLDALMQQPATLLTGIVQTVLEVHIGWEDIKLILAVQVKLALNFKNKEKVGAITKEMLKIVQELSQLLQMVVIQWLYVFQHILLL